MKKILILIVCTTAILALYSCGLFEDEKPSKDTEGVKTIVEFPDSIKKKIVEQDVLMTELLNKVDTLTKEMNSTKAENADLKEKLADLESPKNTLTYISICAFFLGLVALIVTFFKSKGVKEERVCNIVEKYFDDYKIKELRVNVNNLVSSQRNNKTSHTSSSYAPNSDPRFRQLENQMAQVVEAVNKILSPAQQDVSHRQETSRPREENEYQKVGYAKVDTDMYFTTIYDSNQEGCVFKITFTGQTKGRFNIIALDKIQSRNDWQKKVECSGDVSIKEASDFRLEEEGLCEKIDEYSWKVTKPLKIRLLK
jgi:hypothetical protein